MVKSIDLPGGQINEPSSGKCFSLPFLPATPSSLFLATRRTSVAINLASCVASKTPEKQGHCQVCRIRHGGPRTPQETDLNLELLSVVQNISYPSGLLDNLWVSRLMPLPRTSGWPSGLRRCVQVAVHFCGRGFESHF